MPRKDISLLSERELALIVLSKLLYSIARQSSGMEEIVSNHRSLLIDYMDKGIDISDTSDTPPFSIRDIPWESILDTLSAQSDFLNRLKHEHQFSTQEIRYMCAMLCGLSGKEYGLVTGLKSHYNISWTIRHKLGIAPKTTNLRISLQKLSCDSQDESTTRVVPK